MKGEDSSAQTQLVKLLSETDGAPLRGLSEHFAELIEHGELTPAGTRDAIKRELD